MPYENCFRKQDNYTMSISKLSLLLSGDSQDDFYVWTESYIWDNGKNVRTNEESWPNLESGIQNISSENDLADGNSDEVIPVEQNQDDDVSEEHLPPRPVVQQVE